MNYSYDEIEAFWKGSTTYSHKWHSSRRLEWGQNCLGAYLALDKEGPKGKALEWGCGYGCILEAFQPYLESYIAVDISAKPLEHCESLAQIPFRPLLVDIRGPESVETELLDLFLAYAVVHHFPSYEYLWRVVDVAWKLLKPGGKAVFATLAQNGPKQLHKKYDISKIVTFDKGCFGEQAKSRGWELVGAMTDPKRYEHTLLKKPIC